MRATFFNQPWLASRYPPGTRLVLHGKADRGGRFRVSHHAVGSEIATGETRLGRPLSGGRGRQLHPDPGARARASPASRRRRRAARAGVRVAERLPERGGGARRDALQRRGGAQAESARERLAFEELLLTQLVFLIAPRPAGRASDRRLRLSEPATLSARWLRAGTAVRADRRSAQGDRDDRQSDLERAQPMQRLLMGEVGSGKTVVALHAMLRAVEHGAQAALMAPTETLAEQHFATVQRLLGAEPVTVALLTGSTAATRRADTLGKLASGELSLIVGTHALIEPTVRFRELAVAVVDEQHRFGVRQRAALEGQEEHARPPTRAAHDRDADPAHARARALWRPRSQRAARAAARAQADRHAASWRVRAAARRPIALLREQMRAGRQALRGLPACRGGAGGPEGARPPRRPSESTRAWQPRR